MKILLVTIATGKYASFLPELIRTGKEHFLPGIDTNFLIISDCDNSLDTRAGWVKVFPAKHLGWPFATLYRYKLLLLTAETIRQYEYVYYVDADMKFAEKIEADILPGPGENTGLTGTTHPSFLNKSRPPQFENNPASAAFIPQSYRGVYFQGCFWGGRTEAILKMTKILSDKVEMDCAKRIIPRYWDEAYLNWYFFANRPAIILSPAYAYPEDRKLPLQPKIIHLKKHASQMRSLIDP